MFPHTGHPGTRIVLPRFRRTQFNGGMSPVYSGTATSEQDASPTGDALLASVAPIWQITIGACVVVALVAASVRLARRGRSRMTTALLVTGAAIVSLALIGILTGGR